MVQASSSWVSSQDQGGERCATTNLILVFGKELVKLDVGNVLTLSIPCLCLYTLQTHMHMHPPTSSNRILPHPRKAVVAITMKLDESSLGRSSTYDREVVRGSSRGKPKSSTWHLVGRKQASKALRQSKNPRASKRWSALECSQWLERRGPGSSLEP